MYFGTTRKKNLALLGNRSPAFKDTNVIMIEYPKFLIFLILIKDGVEIC